MHSYVDEHEHVTGKGFWERLKKDVRVAFYKVPLRSTLFITTTTLIANQPCSRSGGGGGELPFDRDGDAARRVA